MGNISLNYRINVPLVLMQAGKGTPGAGGVMFEELIWYMCSAIYPSMIDSLYFRTFNLDFYFLIFHLIRCLFA